VVLKPSSLALECKSLGILFIYTYNHYLPIKLALACTGQIEASTSFIGKCSISLGVGIKLIKEKPLPDSPEST